ncbi:MAG: flavin reductase family protein [Planctomycetota bacterium]|jgi:flavin reductase (DIM6/NTAB) family NADH-FMN oxidoreductase RutF
MAEPAERQLISLDPRGPIWERFFTIAPLVIVGSREPDGSHDLAPKHLAMPLGWSDYFGFICTPHHRTYQNIRRERAFTVSFPRPDQVVLASLSAAPRCDDQSKPSLAALPTFAARAVDGVLLEHAYLYLECELDRFVHDLDTASLIVGRIVAAHVDRDSLRVADQDDQDVVSRAPLLAYLAPGRYATIERSFSFPFPAGFHR